MNIIEVFNFGYVNCFYFELLYVFVLEWILFEFVIDGLGFVSDELYEIFGEKLVLFLFLELKCVEIEKMVCLINMKWSW